jgi:nitroreductase
MEDFRALVKKRRSVREYQDTAVDLGMIREIIADACEAPSAGNRQPWGFIIVTSREVMKRLSQESKKNLLADMKKLRSPMLRLYRPVLKDENFNVFYNAPCLVYITGPRDVHSINADCSLAAAYFMFSAADRGLGTCWIDLGSHIKDAALCKEIGLPNDHRIVATLIVGYPRTVPGRLPRKKADILKIIE